MARDGIAAGKAEAIQEALAVCADPDTIEGREGARRLVDLTGKLRDGADCSRLLLGGVLALLKKDRLWEHVARRDEEWPDFCERAVGLKVRTCEYLVSMHNRAVEFGLDFERLDRLGWTKARSILGVATTEDLDAWLKRAEGMTRDEVAKEAKRQKKPSSRQALAEREGVLFDVLKVQVLPDEKALIESSIDKMAELLAQRPGALTSRGHALSSLCGEWAVSHLDDHQQSLAWFVARLEHAFGVKITVEQLATAETRATG